MKLQRGLADLLVRRRAWWYNKVPLSVTFGLLLVDGHALTWSALAALLLLVLAVCAAANYGYAVNELFDIGEDARAGRVNAASSLGTLRVQTIAFASASVALLVATAAGGVIALVVTLLEVAQPLAYSVPPLRIKERGWLAVGSDALAAHVYPAVLALLAVTHWHARSVPVTLAVAAVVWSATAGTRGILGHLLSTAERDRGAGLRTVAHVHGHFVLERAVRIVLVPLELIAFVGILLTCSGGAVLWAAFALYAGSEAGRALLGMRSTALRAEGHRAVAFAEERFYKAWGPIVVALDAARADLRYLLVVVIALLLFRPLVVEEVQRARALIAALSRSRATARDARSSGGV